MKRVLSFFLSFVMLLSITTGIDLSAYAASNPYPGNSNTNCTYYVWQRTKDKLGIELPAWGDAKTWYESAKRAGYTVSSKPGANWIGVYDGGAAYDNKYRGHVVFVESVSGNTMKYSEGGYNGSTHSGNRNITANDGDKKLLGYFNPKKDTTTNTVKITFNGNGGTVSVSSLNVTAGKTMGSNIPTAVRSGYTFEGWYTAASGGTKYVNSTTITAGNKTLYAHWTKNHYTGLRVGGVYQIQNVKAMKYLQTSGSSEHSLVKLQNESNSLSQYWRVTAKDSNGYYQFQTMNGGKALDVDTRNGRYNNGNNLQIYTAGGSDAQKFSIVDRSNDTVNYSIHNVYSGRTLDCKGAETAVNTQLQQYYYNGGAQQLFRFSEVTNREITYYDNLNNNYLPTPREEYSNSGGSTPKNCYYSRNTDTVTVNINSSQNMLTINSKKIGSSGNDITFASTINGSYNYDMYNKDTSTYWLIFRAKASVNGAKMYFRWGYDPVSGNNVKSITLSDTYQVYKIELPRTINSGSNVHSWIDSVCTVQMDNIRLVDAGVTESCQGYGYNYTGKTVKNISYTHIANYKYYSLPTPQYTPDGYIFDGWYTKRTGGTKVTTSTDLGYNQKLYAHWVKNTSDSHIHKYSVTVTAPTCTAKGYTKHICECGHSYVDNYVNAIGHTYKKAVTKATEKADGKIVDACTKCKTVKSTTAIPKIASVALSTTATYYNGKVKTPGVTVKDSKGKTLKKGTDYTVSFASGRKNVGRYAVTVTFKGNYSGKKTLYFNIIPRGVSKINSVTPKSKGFVVNWTKQRTQTTGYQIQYSTNKNMSGAKTITMPKNTYYAKNIKGLKGNKRYYVRIRTYKVTKFNGKNYNIYSPWCATKSVITKR